MKAVWPLCEPPRATSMAPVGVSRTKIPPYPPATASRGAPAPMSWRISNDTPDQENHNIFSTIKLLPTHDIS